MGEENRGVEFRVFLGNAHGGWNRSWWGGTFSERSVMVSWQEGVN